MARIVYSSDRGRICPTCGHPASACRCSAADPAARGDGIVRVRREVKGRKGRTVTTVSGIPLDGQDLKRLASELKKKCGSGGGAGGGILEIQGDHVELLIRELAGRGYTVRKAGG